MTCAPQIRPVKPRMPIGSLQDQRIDSRRVVPPGVCGGSKCLCRLSKRQSFTGAIEDNEGETWRGHWNNACVANRVAVNCYYVKVSFE